MQNKKDFTIRSIILSMDKPFTMEELVSITKKNKCFDSDMIISIVSDLSEAGLLTHIGDLFCVKLSPIMGI